MTARSGFLFGLAAYLCWGAFPLFFSLLTDVDPFQIIPFRVASAMLFCVVLVTALRAWRPVAGILRSRRSLFWFTVSGLLLYINWQLFVLGIVTGHIIETALGYFINPLFTILIGVFVRRERLRPAQWAAVGIAAVGVVISSIAYGVFPWISVGLAFTFGLYSAVRKIANENVDAITALTVETLVTTPVLVVQLVVVWLLAGGVGYIGSEFVAHGPRISILLLLSGIFTAIPLIFFGAANRRLPLTHLGFLQFLTPVLSFLTGYLIFHEEMPLARWLGFVAVWIAIVILLTDMVRWARRQDRGGGRKLV
ncbi:EamA family transporter RarD [Leucobacter sp. GX24907]